MKKDDRDTATGIIILLSFLISGSIYLAGNVGFAVVALCIGFGLAGLVLVASGKLG